MLANAYLPAITAIFGAAASLLLAIILELPILKLIWRRPLRRLAGWVLLANLVSAAVGMITVFNDRGPGMVADPWEVHQHWLGTYAIHVGLLLALTLATEGIVYYILNRRTAQHVTAAKLLLGTLVSNFASYSVLIGLTLWSRWPDQAVRLLPDTAWLRPCDERVWFVEPGSRHLCSIRLDGTDRRTEIAEPLGRFDSGFYDVSLYALLPDRQSIVFVSPGLDWRVAAPGGIKSLGVKVKPDERGFLGCREVIASFPGLLEKISVSESKSANHVWSNTTSQTGIPVVMSDEAGGYRATTTIAGGGGTGFGLSVHGPDKSLEFKVPAGPAYLVCCEPTILPKRKLVVFRCSARIMVMDIETGRVGRLASGDSLVAVAPAFDWSQQGPRSSP